LYWPRALRAALAGTAACGGPSIIILVDFSRRGVILIDLYNRLFENGLCFRHGEGLAALGTPNPFSGRQRIGGS
jgi:hypothetical protein